MISLYNIGDYDFGGAELIFADLDKDGVYAGTRTTPARSIDRTLPEKNRTVLY